MADLVTSESRRYLHGIQNTIISDDDTGVALNVIPADNQLALIDEMEVDGTLTVYGDVYVTSSKNADSLAGINHNGIVGRDVYAAHPASAVSVVPVGSIIATDMQSAIAALDAGKVASNPSLTPSTKTKITYDSKGLVTAGSDATASDIVNTPAGDISATTVQAAINELDSEKGGLAQDNTWVGSNTFTQSLTALEFVKSGGTSGQFLKADGSVDSSSYETTITAGTTSQYYRGDKTWQAMDTAAVTESTNLYFTNARVLGTVLTGLDTTLTGAVVASDTILAAIGKLENRVAGFTASVVSSFNTRTGAVTLTSGDVTGALGFSPSPDTHTHPASSITNTPVAPITSTNVQGALNEVASLANSASSAASSAQSTANGAASAASAAQTTANNAASSAAYADRLARSGHNLIKNGNSEDPNPTGYEAAYVTSSGSYSGNKARQVITWSGAMTWGAFTPLIPCSPGEWFNYQGVVGPGTPTAHAWLVIYFYDANQNWVGAGAGYEKIGTGWYADSYKAQAPANAAFLAFGVEVSGNAWDGALIDNLYATRMVSAGMLEADAVRSTTHAFTVSDTTASTSTTTGAIVAGGGIATGDYFTGRYRSQDGSAGLTATRTFYAASTSGGAVNVLNTVTIKDGIITAWTQA